MQIFGGQSRFVLAGFVIAALVAAGCSSAAPKLRPKGSTSFSISVPGTAIDPTRVPLPNEMHQKVGLGEHFRVAVTTAKRVDNKVRIGINLFYSGVVKVALAGFASNISIRDGLFGSDVAGVNVVPNVAEMAPGQTVDLVLTFATSGSFTKTPTLYLHGAALPGSLAATFNLSFK